MKLADLKQKIKTHAVENPTGAAALRAVALEVSAGIRKPTNTAKSTQLLAFQALVLLIEEALSEV